MKGTKTRALILFTSFGGFAVSCVLCCYLFLCDEKQENSVISDVCFFRLMGRQCLFGCSVLFSFALWVLGQSTLVGCFFGDVFFVLDKSNEILKVLNVA